MFIYMSVYVLSSRVSSVEYSVDELGKKVDSFNAVLSGTTTINGPAILSGPVTLGSSITGIDISDVAGLQTALDLKAPSASPIFTGTTTGITKDTIGLGSVDNTADADKPISTATQTALDGKADKTNTYTKGDVDTKISNLIASAPNALNTLNELAQALANDPNHATTVMNQIALKSDKTYVDGKLALQANQLTTYTKTEVDAALGLKANQSVTYTKTEVDTALGLKANQSITNTKTEVDTSLGLKANQSTTYTKTEVDSSLALKANQSITYTITQADNLLAQKQPTITPSTNLT